MTLHDVISMSGKCATRTSLKIPRTDNTMAKRKSTNSEIILMETSVSRRLTILCIMFKIITFFISPFICEG
jgi:hypothetical protein